MVWTQIYFSIWYKIQCFVLLFQLSGHLELFPLAPGSLHILFHPLGLKVFFTSWIYKMLQDILVLPCCCTRTKYFSKASCLVPLAMVFRIEDQDSRTGCSLLLGDTASTSSLQMQHAACSMGLLHSQSRGSIYAVYINIPPVSPK